MRGPVLGHALSILQKWNRRDDKGKFPMLNKGFLDPLPSSKRTRTLVTLPKYFCTLFIRSSTC